MSRRVLFDTNFFSWYCNAASSVAFEAEDSGDTLEKRFSCLLQDLDSDDAEVIIPAPVLAEALSCSNTDPRSVLALINDEVRFRVVPFGQRAAEEFGFLFKYMKRPKTDDRIVHKFDLLILAIAKIEEVDTIYSADKPMRNVAGAHGIDCVDFQGLRRPVPPAQDDLFPPGRPGSIH